MDWLCDSLSTSDHGPVPLIAQIYMCAITTKSMDALDICYSRGYAIARCQTKTTLKSYWHELRDHQEYSKKIAMKTGTHTQVPLYD